MWTFTPPTSDDTPRLEESTRGPAARLFSFFPTHRRGLNVYKYANGSYSTADPEHNSAELTTDLAPTVTYYGGHIYTVDDTEAAALTAAGFGANLAAPPNTIDAHLPTRTFDPYGADITAGARQLAVVGAVGVPGPNTAPQSGIQAYSYGAGGYGDDYYGGH